MRPPHAATRDRGDRQFMGMYVIMNEMYIPMWLGVRSTLQSSEVNIYTEKQLIIVWHNLEEARLLQYDREDGREACSSSKDVCRGPRQATGFLRALAQSFHLLGPFVALVVRPTTFGITIIDLDDSTDTLGGLSIDASAGS